MSNRQTALIESQDSSSLCISDLSLTSGFEASSLFLEDGKQTNQVSLEIYSQLRCELRELKMALSKESAQNLGLRNENKILKQLLSEANQLIRARQVDLTRAESEINRLQDLNNNFIQSIQRSDLQASLLNQRIVDLQARITSQSLTVQSSNRTERSSKRNSIECSKHDLEKSSQTVIKTLNQIKQNTGKILKQVESTSEHSSPRNNRTFTPASPSTTSVQAKGSEPNGQIQSLMIAYNAQIAKVCDLTAQITEQRKKIAQLQLQYNEACELLEACGNPKQISTDQLHDDYKGSARRQSAEQMQNVSSLLASDDSKECSRSTPIVSPNFFRPQNSKSKLLSSFVVFLKKLLENLFPLLPDPAVRVLSQFIGKPGPYRLSHQLTADLREIYTAHLLQLKKLQANAAEAQSMSMKLFELEKSYELLSSKFATLEREYLNISKDNLRLIQLSNLPKQIFSLYKRNRNKFNASREQQNKENIEIFAKTTLNI